MSAHYVELQVHNDNHNDNLQLESVEISPTTKLKAKIASYFSSKEFRLTLKSLIAFSIASLFSFVDPLADFVYPGNRLLAVCAVLFNVGMSLGGMVELAIIFFISILSGALCALSALSVSIHLEFGLFCILFVLVFVYSWLRAALSQKWQTPLMIGSFVMILSIIMEWRTEELRLQPIAKITLSCYIGVAIAFIVTMLVLPWSAANALHKELLSSLLSMSDTLKTCCTCFMFETELECLKGAQTTLKQHFSKLSTLLEDAKFEINFSKYSHKEWKELIRKDKKLLQNSLALLTCVTKNWNTNTLATKDLMEDLKTPTMTVVECCRKMIGEMNSVMNSDGNTKQKIPREELDISLIELDTQQHEAIQKWFKSHRSDPTTVEQVFQLYFFLFVLQEFAKCLRKLSVDLENNNRPKVLHFPPISIFFQRKRELSIKIPSKHATFEEENPQTLRYRLWKMTQDYISTPESRHALKVSVAVSVLTAPAFLTGLKNFCITWRIEWAILTVLIVSTQTFGTALFNSVWRILGTVVGAIVAIIAWKIFPDNPYGLFTCTVIYAIPCLHIKNNPKYAKVALVSLMAFAVIVFGKYVYKNDPTYDSIELLAMKRGCALSVGIVVSMIVNRAMFPYLARVEARHSIGRIMHHVAHLYTVIVSIFMTHSAEVKKTTFKEVDKLGQKIQLAILRSEELLGVAKTEPRLKGLFPTPTYLRVVDNLQFILEKFLIANLILKRGFSDHMRDHVILPLAPARKDVVTNVLLLFWIVAGALESKTPLPRLLPNAQGARVKLLEHFHQLPAMKEQLVHKNANDYITFYAYAEIMKDLVKSLEGICTDLKSLYGEYSHVVQLERVLQQDTELSIN